ncbi:MAG: hypothetical protein OXN16_02255 [Gammaproteobacteria bacterium]|nr:hypothetical protein [Gammaproteobacteria bacterium]
MTNPAATGYRPAEPIGVPPLYAWPPRPLAALRYLFVEMAYPWGYVFAALSVVLWQWLTPSMETMATLSPDWMALVWLRNAAVLTLFAGGLHWWLYIRRRQERDYKFNTAWMARDDDRFTFGDQVRDNVFWSLASGVTIWTLYECGYSIYESPPVCKSNFRSGRVGCSHLSDLLTRDCLPSGPDGIRAGVSLSRNRPQHSTPSGVGSGLGIAQVLTPANLPFLPSR